MYIIVNVFYLIVFKYYKNAITFKYTITYKQNKVRVPASPMTVIGNWPTNCN